MPKKRIIKDKGGYSLVELMVVITIMAILAASSTAVYTGYIKKARSAEMLAQCRAVYVAAETYFIEYSKSFNGDEAGREDMEDELFEMTHLNIEVLDDSEMYSKSDGSYGVVVYEDSGNWMCEEILCEVNGEVWSLCTESGEFREKIK